MFYELRLSIAHNIGRSFLVMRQTWSSSTKSTVGELTYLIDLLHNDESAEKLASFFRLIVITVSQKTICSPEQELNSVEV